MAFSCWTFSQESSILNVWKCFKYPFTQNSTLKSRYEKYVNQFHATDFFSYALKTSEDPWFSDAFRGYQKRSVAWNGLMKLCLIYHEYVNVTDSLFHNQLSLTWWWGVLCSFLKKITQIKKSNTKYPSRHQAYLCTRFMYYMCLKITINAMKCGKST